MSTWPQKQKDVDKFRYEEDPATQNSDNSTI